MINFIHNYDFIILVETFVKSIDNSLFSSTHIAFVSPGIKLSDSAHGRLSGGVIILVRKRLCAYVKQVYVEFDNFIVLKLSRTVMGTSKDCLLIGAYIPPENSIYYQETEICNGISILEDCLLDLYKLYGDCPKIVCGDLNARTSSFNYNNDPLNEMIDLFDTDNDFEQCTNNLSQRVSKDKTINAFGRYLLGLCDEFHLIITNGLKSIPSHSEAFTYVSNSGCSVIDYIIVSDTLVSQCLSQNVSNIIESKHAVVELHLLVNSQSPDVQRQRNNVPRTIIAKYKWDESKRNNFCSVMNSDSAKEIITEATLLIGTNIDAALTKFNEYLLTAGECMKKNIIYGNEKNKKWFDLECRQSRTALRKLLRKFIKSNLDCDRRLYVEKRKQYKELLKSKKQKFKDSVVESLTCYSNNPKEFWNTVRSFKRKADRPSGISTDDWFKHFYDVFNDFPIDEQSDMEFNCRYRDSASNESSNDGPLDQPITLNEIESAIRALKGSKAAGPDGLIGEFFKACNLNIMPFLLKFFNNIFDNGTFPDDWTVSILHPLHKKGDTNVADNYRGISLLNVCSKIYSFILNKRLTNWIEENNIIGEEQAGFRRDRSTNDHIFTMLAVIQKQLLRHRKLYVAFIDFKKAFDSVRRDKLWRVLLANGVNGKFLNALKSMYNVVLARVRAGADLTDAFLCPRGLKQGEACSPVLFSLFINELTKEINEQGRHGIQLSPEFVQILILLFADDVALMSDSIVGLQTQLNILYKIANVLDLVVNLDKSNIVVFRNGGHLSQNEKWHYGEQPIQTVNMYKYLGVYLTTRLSFQSTLSDLAERGRKGCSAIISLLWSVGEHAPSIFFKLFDCQIQPVLTYGAEIWGLTANQEVIERVHLSALKRFMGVSQRAPRYLVYGELGRHPLYVITYLKCIKYWLRIVYMDNERFPKKAYNMLLSLQSQNYVTWACSVRNVLYKFGFGIVWETQSVGDVNMFLNELRQRLIDCFAQDWHSAILGNAMFEVYSSVNHSLNLKSYLVNVKCIQMRHVFARFRIGMSPLRSRSIQFVNRSNINTDCPFCTNTPETEFHFLLVCPKYDYLRTFYIPMKFFRQPSAFKMSLLLASNNERLIACLCNFILKALNVRNEALDGVTSGVSFD